MKFSKKLQHYVNQKYSQHYLSYKELKKAIKLITGSDTSSYTINEVTSNFGNIRALAGPTYRPAESRFMDLLNHELDKINSFSNIMYSDIKDSLKEIQEYTFQIGADLGLNFNQDSLPEKIPGQSSVGNDTGNSPSNVLFQVGISKELLEDLVSPLEEQLENRGNDLVFLESYQQLNYTGFRKITKKYDKMNKSSSSSWYLARLARESFMNLNLDLLLEKLSNCYSRIQELKKALKLRELGRGEERVEQFASQDSPEVHSKHLILAEDVMKVKVLLAKTVPLVSVGLLTIQDGERLPPASSPQSSLSSQRVAGSKASLLALQTSTVSYLYFDNGDFSEYHRIQEIRKRLSSVGNQSNSQCEEALSTRIQAYSDEKIVPRKYLDFTFRLRWYGENEGSPDQWLNLDWIHPMEPSCSSAEWFEQSQSPCFSRPPTSEGSKSFVASKTLLIQQKDVFHIIRTFGTLSRESKNPSLACRFELSSYLGEAGRNLTQDQIMLLTCFIDFINFRKLGPFSHLWFHRTTFASQNKLICIHVDTHLKTTPEMDSELIIDENARRDFPGMAIRGGKYEPAEAKSVDVMELESNMETEPEPKAKSKTNGEKDNNELGNSSLFNSKPSIMYNTFVVSPQTEALVSESIKTISHGILSISFAAGAVSQATPNGNAAPISSAREFLKDVLGLASVSEVSGFSNLETCTALLHSSNLKHLPHWFNFIAIESETQQETEVQREANFPSNSEPQTFQSLNRSLSLSREIAGGKLPQELEKPISNPTIMPKIDVLHTGKNARILHDQEATAQREANLLSNSLSSLNSSQTLNNLPTPLCQVPPKPKHTQVQVFPHTLQMPLLPNDVEPRMQIGRTSIINRITRFLGGLPFMGQRELSEGGRGRTLKASVSSAVRVEPKTFFANERTLLQWMNMSVLLATISVSLLSFGTQVGRICGMIMSPVAIFFIAYSYHIYLKRNRALERKEPISYNDRFGPTLLVFSLIISLTSVLLLNIMVGGHKQHFKDFRDQFGDEYSAFPHRQPGKDSSLIGPGNYSLTGQGNYLYY
ncbi:putative vacuolar transporter chaperone [Cryptosporidium felis]|nr:putative vacuolar transporter chaperone [Cryptosporidium felis]